MTRASTPRISTSSRSALFRRTAILGIGSVLLIVAAGGAVAIASSSSLRDLTKTAFLGASHLSELGDVNGDGEADILLADCSAQEAIGNAYVVFGPFHKERIDLRNLGERGFVIQGSAPDSFPCAPAEAGDVNGDGLADILIGAFEADSEGRESAGRIYVVFGKASNEAVDLTEFDQNRQGPKGFRIDGPSERALAGNDLDGLGDVNGDGLDDVGIAAPFAGGVYVVFGKSDFLPVDLLAFDLGTHMGAGYRIVTGSPSRNSGLTVNEAGDVNGDGTADIVVGYIPRLSAPGSAYVVFGDDTAEDVHTQELGSNGFEVKGTERRSSTGNALAALGDTNGDGLDDVAVGAPYRNCCGYGKVFVVYGKKSTTTLKTSHLERHGYTIVAARHDDGTGLSIAGMGDVNADGRSDFLVGVDGSSLGGRRWSGSVYVVYGRQKGGDVRLPHLRRRGYRIDGTRESDFFGLLVSGPGDVTGDGIPDILSYVDRAPGVALAISGKRP